MGSSYLGILLLVSLFSLMAGASYTLDRIKDRLQDRLPPAPEQPPRRTLQQEMKLSLRGIVSVIFPLATLTLVFGSTVLIGRTAAALALLMMGVQRFTNVILPLRKIGATRQELAIYSALMLAVLILIYVITLSAIDVMYARPHPSP